MNSNSTLLLKNVATKLRALEDPRFTLDTDVARDVYDKHKRSLIEAHERLASAVLSFREATLDTRAFLSLRVADRPRFRETRLVADPNTLVVLKRGGKYFFMVGSLRGATLVDLNTKFLEPDLVDADNDALALLALLTRVAPDAPPPPPLLTLYQFLQQQQQR